jgi:two-component system, NarL family, response regulator NreC
MNSAEQIRVVVVDEHALVRAGLRALLLPAAEVNVVAETADASAAVAMARQAQAQVLLVDRPAGGEDGAAVAALLRAASLRTQLLLLTVAGSPSRLESLIEAGACGYLTRTAVERDLLDAVRAVARGEVYRCPMALPLRAGDGADATTADAERRRFERLTEREREVLVCTAHGFTAPEIGARLNISPKTVDTYKQRIHEKLGLHHRTDYVQMVLRLRLMEAD